VDLPLVDDNRNCLGPVRCNFGPVGVFVCSSVLILLPGRPMKETGCLGIVVGWLVGYSFPSGRTHSCSLTIHDRFRLL
jgi:hypothetical protein